MQILWNVSLFTLTASKLKLKFVWNLYLLDLFVYIWFTSIIPVHFFSFSLNVYELIYIIYSCKTTLNSFTSNVS